MKKLVRILLIYVILFKCYSGVLRRIRIIRQNYRSFAVEICVEEWTKNTNLTDLMKEYDDIHEKRTNLEKTVSELNNAKNLIQSIM